MGVEKGWVGVRNGGVKSGDDRLVVDGDEGVRNGG